MDTPTLDRPASTRSLHAQILADIETRILAGEWPPGYRIPFESELTVQYSCSRMTVSKALAQLVRSGLIERRRKAGSFVTRPQSQSAVLEIRDVQAEVASLGLPYAFTLLKRQKRRASRADRDRIGVAAGQTILAVTVRHDAATQPFCFEERLISLAAVPDAENQLFLDMAPGVWLMAKVPWTTAEHRISAAGAIGDVAWALQLAEGSPCLVVERRTWIGEQAVTNVRLSYPADRHALIASFTPAQG